MLIPLNIRLVSIPSICSYLILYNAVIYLKLHYLCCLNLIFYALHAFGLKRFLYYQRFSPSQIWLCHYSSALYNPAKKKINDIFIIEIIKFLLHFQYYSRWSDHDNWHRKFNRILTLPKGRFLLPLYCLVTLTFLFIIAIDFRTLFFIIFFQIRPAFTLKSVQSLFLDMFIFRPFHLLRFSHRYVSYFLDNSFELA